MIELIARSDSKPPTTTVSGGVCCDTSVQSEESVLMLFFGVDCTFETYVCLLNPFFCKGKKSFI